MVKVNSSRSVGLEVGESGVVSHVGLWVLGGFADRLGLGGVLSEAFGIRRLVHDRGSVLVHAMLMLSGGGEACTDIEHLRGEAGLFGEVASDSTLYRTMRSIDPDTLGRLGGAVARVRNQVWNRLVNTDGAVVLDIDSSLHEVHSENKEGTAPNYKRGFGFHPMYCTLDVTGETLAVLLRPGNAAANNVADHTKVLDAAIDALPARVALGHRRGDDPGAAVQPLRVRTDSAGGPSFAKACRRRNVGFSVGVRRAPYIESAIGQVSVDDPRWIPALPRKRNRNENIEDTGNQQPQQPDEQNRQDEQGEEQKVRAHVIDLTEAVDTSSWPEGTRLIVRREPKHAGAQRSLFPSDDYRYWGHWTDNKADPAQSDADIRAHARVENNIARLKDSGANRFPFTDLDANRAWLTLVTWADALVRWFQLLCLRGTHLHKARPKTLRWYLWHTPARLVRHARKTTIRIPHTWPTAQLLHQAHQHITALT